MKATIHVRTHLGNIYKAVISEDTTSNEVLAQIKPMINAGTREFSLSNGYEVLDPQISLFQQHVRDENLLFLVPFATPYKKVDMKKLLTYCITVFVITPKGENIPIRVVPNDTIQSIYNRVFPGDNNVTLLFNGVRANPQMKLAEYGIGEGSILMGVSY